MQSRITPWFSLLNTASCGSINRWANVIRGNSKVRNRKRSTILQIIVATIRSGFFRSRHSMSFPRGVHDSNGRNPEERRWIPACAGMISILQPSGKFDMNCQLNATYQSNSLQANQFAKGLPGAPTKLSCDFAYLGLLREVCCRRLLQPIEG